jgi:streptogramin lyase
MDRRASLLVSLGCALLTAACSSGSAEHAATATGPGTYIIRGVDRTPRGIAVLPAAGRVFTISAAGNRGTLDAYDLTLRPLGSAAVCARPVWIAGDDADARLLIGCRAGRARKQLAGAGLQTQLLNEANDMLERFGGDHRGSIAVVDARTLRVIARVRDVDTSTVAAFVPNAHATAYAEGARGALLRIDAVTGRAGPAIALPHATPGQLQLVAGGDAAPLLVVDEHDGTAYVMQRDGTPREVAFGQSRLPSAASLAGDAAFVALGGAGSVARVNAVSGVIERTIAACDTPVSVFAGSAHKRVFAVCAPPEASSRHVVWFDANGDGRTDVAIPDEQGMPYPVGAVFSALDDVTGRVVVATAHRVDVIDPGGESFVAVPDAGHGMIALAVDTVHGDAYAAFGDPRGAGIARIGIRAARPWIPDVAGRIGDGVRSNGAMTTNMAWVVFSEASGPGRRYPPGSRSPAELALRPDGSFAVADRSSPVLGALRDGSYREEPLEIAARSIALARDGTLWYAGGPSREHGIVGHRAGGGRVVRYAIESGRPDKIVPAADGLYWFSRGLHPVVGRIASDGSIRRHAIPRPAADAMVLDIAAAPRGGCYLLYYGAVVTLAPDGTTRTFARLPNAFSPPGAITALANGTVAVSGPRRLLFIAPGGALHTVQVEPEPHRAAFSTVEPPGCTLAAPAEGPDGSVWGACADDVVAVTRSGAVRRFTLPFPQSHAQSFVRASDGAMWFAEPTQSKIGRIAPDGRLTEVTI